MPQESTEVRIAPVLARHFQTTDSKPLEQKFLLTYRDRRGYESKRVINAVRLGESRDGTQYLRGFDGDARKTFRVEAILDFCEADSGAHFGKCDVSPLPWVPVIREALRDHQAISCRVRYASHELIPLELSGDRLTAVPYGDCYPQGAPKKTLKLQSLEWVVIQKIDPPPGVLDFVRSAVRNGVGIKVRCLAENGREKVVDLSPHAWEQDGFFVTAKQRVRRQWVKDITYLDAKTINVPFVREIENHPAPLVRELSLTASEYLALRAKKAPQGGPFLLPASSEGKLAIVIFAALLILWALSKLM